jgi:hypothetical protein
LNLEFESIGVEFGRRSDVPGKQLAALGIGLEATNLTAGTFLSRLDVQVLVDDAPSLTISDLQEQARQGAVAILQAALTALEGSSISNLKMREVEQDAARKAAQDAALHKALSAI